MRRRRLSPQDWHQMNDLIYTRDELSQAKFILGHDLSPRRINYVDINLVFTDSSVSKSSKTC